MKRLIFILILDSFISCVQPEKKSNGPYLGQNLPGDSPELFAPGIVNTSISTRDITFTPDGKYFFFMSTRSEKNKFSELTYSNLKEMHNSPENGNSNIYWMKSDFIEELKEKATFTKNEEK